MFALLVKHLEDLWIKLDTVAMHHDFVQIGDENLAVELVEAVKHGEEHVFQVHETAARAWLETRVCTIPRLAVLMDEMTASANKSARRQRVLRLWRHGVQHELEGLRHHLGVQRGGVVLGRHLRLRRDGVQHHLHLRLRRDKLHGTASASARGDR